ncbi:MAG: hypothetical protein H7326_09140, partial [Bdellovibrionaceae bacterium]|nr:hypothetical protein [Pseudobdellovibrionaceae bacterium]
MIELERELQGTYKTIQISESQWEAEMTASATWSYYLGHFPEQAVLPAVAIIDISQFLLSQISPNSEKISKIQDFRIKNPVRPGDKI